MSTSPRLTRRSSLIVIAAAAVTILAAACSSSAASSAPTTAPSAAPPTAAPASNPPASTAPSTAPEASGSAAASVYEVDKASGPVGAYLTGEDGRTLYLFKKDTTGVSNCAGDCATNWPPFVLENGETVKAGTGVSGTLATMTRADGSLQVTYNGLPVYYFAADKAAGDTNGQGVGGVWVVAAP